MITSPWDLSLNRRLTPSRLFIELARDKRRSQSKRSQDLNIFYSQWGQLSQIRGFESTL